MQNLTIYQFVHWTVNDYCLIWNALLRILIAKLKLHKVTILKYEWSSVIVKRVDFFCSFTVHFVVARAITFSNLTCVILVKTESNCAIKGLLNLPLLMSQKSIYRLQIHVKHHQKMHKFSFKISRKIIVNLDLVSSLSFIWPFK